mmetsp:Transcript_6428/g.14777  ORF Transcript_6428/g.14777 Transcript_6428/m.14777 type:complete len:117 (-) Transcript_6428:77-427(-)
MPANISKGPAYVALEVTHPCEDDASEQEVAYQHMPFSQRMARRRRTVRAPNSSARSRLIGGVAAACVVAAFALWAWALVLLLLRLNAIRLPKTQDLPREVANLPGTPQILPALPAP